MDCIDMMTKDLNIMESSRGWEVISVMVLLQIVWEEFGFPLRPESICWILRQEGFNRLVKMMALPFLIIPFQVQVRLRKDRFILAVPTD